MEIVTKEKPRSRELKEKRTDYYTLVADTALYTEPKFPPIGKVLLSIRVKSGEQVRGFFSVKFDSLAKSNPTPQEIAEFELVKNFPFWVAKSSREGFIKTKEDFFYDGERLGEVINTNLKTLVERIKTVSIEKTSVGSSSGSGWT